MIQELIIGILLLGMAGLLWALIQPVEEEHRPVKNDRQTADVPHLPERNQLPQGTLSA